MKKTISIILSLVILTFMALPVYAAGNGSQVHKQQ